MTSIKIFNVCTHGRDAGDHGAEPTPCSLSMHPKNTRRFVTGGGDANVFVK